MAAPITVLKFGSSVLADRSRLPAVVHDVYRAYRKGRRVVVVVSAIGRHTDVLLDEAHFISVPAWPESAVAKLLSTGEEQAAALLTMAANRAGIPCQVLDPSSIRLRVHGDRLDADPYSVDRKLIWMALDETPVIVLPGFTGCHESGGTALLGRGGSDLTAVFLADQLDAEECRLVKDVDGIYDHDPAQDPPEAAEGAARRYTRITYDDAARVAGPLVQIKAVEYLRCVRRRAKVTAVLQERGTVLGAALSQLGNTVAKRKVKVAMLGFGTVGEAVYRHLFDLPDLFSVTGIAVRQRAKHRDKGPPRELLETDVNYLLARDYDVLVDVSGDTSMAMAAIERCFQDGKAAITADKRLVAEHGTLLSMSAVQYGSRFLYSAAVGGSAPMLEALNRAFEAGPVRSLRGVLNATSNYVLDRVAEGIGFADALAEAQKLGFAEADVRRDLSGKDTEVKLRVLVRRAFPSSSDTHRIVREGIDEPVIERLRETESKHQVVRLVARFDASRRGSVRPELLPRDDYLAGTCRDENRLVITGTGGTEWRVSGKGMGPWPAAEAVMADLIDLHPLTGCQCNDFHAKPSAPPQFEERMPSLGDSG